VAQHHVLASVGGICGQAHTERPDVGCAGKDNDQIIPNELANHPAVRFKGGFAAIDAQQPPTQKKGEFGSKTVPTSTQINKK
jgi:hypothetical protein